MFSLSPIDLAFVAVTLLAHLAAAMVLVREPAVQRRQLKWVVWTAVAASYVFLVAGLNLREGAVLHSLPILLQQWARNIVTIWGLGTVCAGAALVMLRVVLRVKDEHSPARRKFLWTSQGVVLGIPSLAFGYGTFIERSRFELVEQEISIPGLPPDLEGLRLVQLTDIHLSPYLSVKELEHTIAMANETRPHVSLVTGDLISFAGDPLDDCLDRLTHLRSDAGTFGCMGNHEIYAEAEDYVEHEARRMGMTFLRQENQVLRFGEARLNLAGVDYQRWGRPYLRGAGKLMDPDATNLLLSHNPDVFPTAARQGFDLTLSGHTHGGQVRFEILERDLTVASFVTPYVQGLYRKDNASIYVSRGIGTIGLPTRFGAPPEVSLLVLRRA